MYYEGKGVIQDDIRAYMWWNITASREGGEREVSHGIVERKMTPAELSKARELVRECIAKNYESC